MKLSFLIPAVLFVLVTSSANADTWVDPEWSTMLNESDLIALVEYSSEGIYRAKAKPVTLYKGKLKTDEIWISGFSNRYGPRDSVSTGDRYLVFLNRIKLEKDRVSRWRESLKEEPDYFKAIMAGNAYNVWSPTSGDLKVEGDSINYNLLQTTTYHLGHPNRSLTEFEEFLSAAHGSRKNRFHHITLQKITIAPSGKNVEQYLMMLQLTSFSGFHSVYETIANEEKDACCFALARLLGQVKDRKAETLLIELLHHKNGIVQGEVVRSLSIGNSKRIAPILLEHLYTTSPFGSGPSNLMDPVRNELSGGQIEIIKALGELGYTPAVKELLTLLKTENEYHFELLIKTIQKLGSDDYIPYINEHLKNQTKSLVFSICRIITENNLEQCKPALMEFISTHNRNNHPSYEYAISSHMGLAHFDDEETNAFLKADFQNLIANKDIKSANLKDWLVRYMEVFRRWDYEESQPLMYEAMYAWYGLNENFVSSPWLFSTKALKEDSLATLAINALKEFDVEEVKCLVYLNNSSNRLNTNVNARIQIELNGKPDPFDTTNQTFLALKGARQRVSKVLNIPIDNSSSFMGAYVSNPDERFDERRDFSLMREFYEFAKTYPNQHELEFLRLLAKNNFALNEFDARRLNEAIESVETELKK